MPAISSPEIFELSSGMSSVGSAEVSTVGKPEEVELELGLGVNVEKIDELCGAEEELGTPNPVDVPSLQIA